MIGLSYKKLTPSCFIMHLHVEIMIWYRNICESKILRHYSPPPNNKDI